MKNLKNFGLCGGYILGMLLQLIILPFITEDFINGIWWTTQLTGLTIMTGLWIYLDRKITIPWMKKTYVDLKTQTPILISKLKTWLYS